MLSYRAGLIRSNAKFWFISKIHNIPSREKGNPNNILNWKLTPEHFHSFNAQQQQQHLTNHTATRISIHGAISLSGGLTTAFIYSLKENCFRIAYMVYTCVNGGHIKYIRDMYSYYRYIFISPYTANEKY